MFDAAIIGTGPAGLSAAINLKMRGKEVIWFGSGDFSGKVEKSEKIGNYPGLGLVSGRELNEKFRAHAAQMGLEITDRIVTNISRLKDRYMLLANNEMYEARALLLATGVVPGRGFDGEKELVGMGVSYCATCDGMFYRGKTIAVFCGAKRYEPEVTYLAEMAAKVYLYAGYPGCEVEAPNVEQLKSTIRQVQGGMRLTGITLADGTEVPVDGLFCLRSAIAPTTLLPGLTLEGPHIVVDRHMATNLPGCFAAGDCTGAPYQIAKAVGEGNIAAHSILDYLAEQGREA